MYLKTLNEYECCGCGACKSVCPKSCIHMEANEQGFLFPVIDKGQCIHCGLCERICKFDKQIACINDNPSCYYGWHIDEKLRHESTSGAAFIAITQVCQELGYSYYSGAVYDEKLVVKHICSKKTNDILSMRTSKYVQSELNDVFGEIREYLICGKKVLFSGTPCQCAGLESFVGEKNRKNLLTVSLVCHGVSSPACFEKYKQAMETSNSSKVIGIRFRDKRMLDGELNHRFTTISMQNGKEDSSIENPYTVMFGLGLMHRRSCSNCQYATPLRNCDITIGDFWGIQQQYPELKGEISKGISLVLAHTEIGEKVCNMLSKYMTIVKLPSYKLCMNGFQQQLLKPFDENKDKDRFIRDVIGGNDYLKEANKVLLKRKIMRYLSKFKPSHIRDSLHYRIGKFVKNSQRDKL